MTPLRQRMLDAMSVRGLRVWPLAHRPSVWCCTPECKTCAATFTCMR